MSQKIKILQSIAKILMHRKAGNSHFRLFVWILKNLHLVLNIAVGHTKLLLKTGDTHRNIFLPEKNYRPCHDSYPMYKSNCVSHSICLPLPLGKRVFFCQSAMVFCAIIAATGQDPASRPMLLAGKYQQPTSKQGQKAWKRTPTPYSQRHK